MKQQFYEDVNLLLISTGFMIMQNHDQLIVTADRRAYCLLENTILSQCNLKKKQWILSGLYKLKDVVHSF